MTYHHIRYAKAARMGEPQMVPYEEPGDEAPEAIACPQNEFRLGFVMGEGEPMAQSEDCHFLSIYTPSREGRLPVLVWIHGGAYMTGCGEESAYDASALAEQGDIVVVTLSYRLGVWGYLYNPQGEPQNLGLKDQLTALRWVHENIARYGGDPQQVTLAGQSAGGHSVAALIAYCKEPLFHKAIIQSAPLGFGFGKGYLAKQYHDFVQLVGKPMAEATTEEVLVAQKRLVEASGKQMCFAPHVPGIGKEIAVPSLKRVLITWQGDDTAPFVAMMLGHEETFGNTLDRWATKMTTSLVFGRGSKRYASLLKRRGIEVSLRKLCWRPEGSRFGACHCLELALLFGSWDRWKGVGMLGNVDEAEWRERAQTLRKQWLAFISSAKKHNVKDVSTL